MNRLAIIFGTIIVLLACLAALVILTIHGDNISQVTGWIMAGVIPTLTSLFAFREASHANENTNGILHKALNIDKDGNPINDKVDANGDSLE